MSQEKFTFVSSGDGNGIISHIGEQNIRVLSSTLVQGTAMDFIRSNQTSVWTKNEPGAWFCVDFGEDLMINPNYYTIYYSATGNYCCPRNWILQGANFDPLDSTTTWDSLSVHTSDTSIRESFKKVSFPITNNFCYRYFRIMQTGMNANASSPQWNQTFIVGGFELYGKVNYGFTKGSGNISDIVNKNYPFVNLQDNKGVIYALGKPRVTVTSSTLKAGKAIDFINRNIVFLWTINEPYAWFCVDLGKGIKLKATHYTLRYSSSAVSGQTVNACCPLHWVLEGSDDQVNWTTVRNHSNDKSLYEGAYIQKMFEIGTQSIGYRFFRVRQIGKNMSSLPTWCDTFVVGGFEIYGYLSDSNQSTVASPIKSSPKASLTTSSPPPPSKPTVTQVSPKEDDDELAQLLSRLNLKPTVLTSLHGLGIEDMESLLLVEDEKDFGDELKLMEKRKLMNEVKRLKSDIRTSSSGSSSDIKSSNSNTATKEPSIEGTKLIGRAITNEDQIQDTEYKGALAIASTYTPSHSCDTELLNYFSQIGIPFLKVIIEDCNKYLTTSKNGENNNESGLNKDELLSLAIYTYDLGFKAASYKDNFYFKFNEVLRMRSNVVMQYWKGYIYYLLSALRKLPDMNLTVYRGVQSSKDIIQKEYKQGRKIHWSAFSSTTTDVNIAKAFSGTSKIVFRLVLLSGKDIQSYSIIKVEKEILLSPNMNFVVANGLKEESDGFFYVNLIQTDSDSDTFVF